MELTEKIAKGFKHTGFCFWLRTEVYKFLRLQKRANGKVMKKDGEILILDLK